MELNERGAQFCDEMIVYFQKFKCKYFIVQSGALVFLLKIN